MKNHYVPAGAFFLLAMLGFIACDGSTPSDSGSTSSSSSSSSSSSGMGGEGGSGGGGGNGGGPDCYSKPTTHVEIINACTDAEKVDKAVNLPLLQPDGSLPPLP